MTQETFSFTYNGQEIPTDKAGYLLDYTLWEEGMVELLAQQENIELTDAHWEVVRFVRAFYEEYETSPAIRALVKAMANKFGPEKVIVVIFNDYLKKGRLNKPPNWLDYLNQRSAYKGDFKKARHHLVLFSVDRTVPEKSTLSLYKEFGPYSHSKYAYSLFFRKFLER